MAGWAETQPDRELWGAGGKVQYKVVEMSLNQFGKIITQSGGSANFISRLGLHFSSSGFED